MKSCFFSVAILVLIIPIPLILRKPQMVPNICKSLTEPWFIARKKKWHRSSWDNRWPSCNSCSNFSDLTYLGATFEGFSNLADCLKKWRITRIYHHSLGFTNLYNHFFRIYQDFTITCRRIRYNLRFFLATFRTWWSIKLGIFDFLDEPILTRMAKAMVGDGVHLGH